VSEITGQVVIVTGAAQGIGACIARSLAREGAQLLLADLQAEKVAGVAHSLRDEGASVASTGVDIADPARAEAMASLALDTFGAVDAIVNNAAIDAPPGLAWEIDEVHWRRLIDVNLSGAWWCIRSVLPHMRARRRGKIVSISSISARLADPATSPAYSAAKAGLIGMTIALSAQLEADGIRVNAITPGATGSTGTPVSEEQRKLYEAVFPLGFGGPQPVADAVLFLLRSSGDWISGAVLNVSGGALRGV
jgi:NAD(P)-dependent dehydrogenase (short-subunit alcohol dehydrogenase family)